MALKQTRRSVSLNRQLYDAATAVASERGVPLAQLVADALRAAGVKAPSTHIPVALVQRAIKARSRKRKVISGAAVMKRIGPIRKMLGDEIADMCGEP